MHLVLGEKVPMIFSQLGEAPMVPTSKKQRGSSAFYSTRKSAVDTLSQLGKSTGLPMDGKKMSREYQDRISERKTGNCGIFR